jgi:hypothetical protein
MLDRVFGLTGCQAFLSTLEKTTSLHATAFKRRQKKINSS